MGKREQARIKQLEQQLANIERRIIPHVCTTCDWFRLRPPEEPPPHNRYCKYPGDIKLVKGTCAMWVVGTDLWKRQPRNITV